MDTSTAIALGGMAIGAASLIFGVIIFADSARRSTVQDMQNKIRDLEDKVAECKKERAEDEMRHTQALTRQREAQSKEMDIMRNQHRSDVESIRADMNFWRELALRHGLGPDNRKEGTQS